MSDKHVFALHTECRLPSLDALFAGRGCVITDSEVWHRLVNVLHARIGEAFIVFDGVVSIQLVLQALPKKGVIEGVVQEAVAIAPLTPFINLYQGIVRREAMQEIAYFAAQMGVSKIIPIKTKKVQRVWMDQKDSERLRKVMIAACEQAKQFCVPIITSPREFDDCVALSKQETQQGKSCTLYFETDGQSFYSALSSMVANNYSHINIFIGPEGGFTPEEQSIMSGADIRSYRLTPTVLRSQEAVAVSVGAIRSVMMPSGGE
jgi:16S rRNA (uracil1498-N3)-methyltransferase